MAACQVIGFDCPPSDLCKVCKGSGDEPVEADGTDLCQHCDRCFDEEVGWSTGIEPETPSAEKVRQLMKAERA